MKNLPLAQKIISLIDLTRLVEQDELAHIKELCAKAVTPLGAVAAVCVYPIYAEAAKEWLKDTPVKIAAVFNFPSGQQPLAKTLAILQHSLAYIDEADIVIPYQDYLDGNPYSTIELLRECKKLCGKQVMLKAILETGALQEPSLIAKASKDAIEAGADFIKTSTGKIAIGATPAAARTMLEAIHTYAKQRNVGCKISGGVRTLEDAQKYLSIAEEILGAQWISAQTFRFGASQLLDTLLETSSINSNPRY